MIHWLHLALAIGCEVIATSTLKLADGFSKPGPTIIALLGYCASFYCLSLALRSLRLGVAYAIWSGVGLVLISLVGFVLYRQSLDLPAMLGIGMIAAGVLVICLFSTALPH